MPFLEQDVLGLDVAMDDVVAMRVIERLGHLMRDLHGVDHRQRLLPREALPQRIAFDERHDVEQQPAGLAVVVQLEDVGMLQAGGDLDLAQKALGAEGRAQLRAQHLDGDPALEAQVVGEKDHGHPAAANLTLHGVAARKRRCEPRAKLVHGL